MDKETDQNKFNNAETFNKDLIKVFTKIINEKLPMFLEFCIQTSNADPIKEVLYTLSINIF